MALSQVCILIKVAMDRCVLKRWYIIALKKESYDNTVFPKGFFNIQKNVEAIPGKNGRIYFFKQNKIFLQLKT